MFDGADLSLVYGSSYDSMGPAPAQTVAVAQPPPPPVVQSMTPEPPAVSMATMSHATAPDLPYNVPNTMYASQGNNTNTSNGVKMSLEPTFWDKVGSRKGDVLKLVVLAMVVLLGISFDRVSTYYMNAYISKAFLTDVQEFLVRVSYPVIIILLLWIIKAYA